MRRRLVLAWIVSLAIAAAVGSALTSAQNPTDFRILSGGDIGFRIEGTNSAGEPVGTLVVRVKDQWVTAKFLPRVYPAR